MPLVGHISGSVQSNSVIGVSGSVIVANRPQALFPSMPGNDVTFFVSGSRGVPQKQKSSFGGDLVVTGSIYSITQDFSSQISIIPDGFVPFSVAVSGTPVFYVDNSGGATAEGDVAVNGGDITTSASAATLFNTTATTVGIGGAATTVTVGSPTGGVVIPGDLTVNGAMTTINTVNLEVKDQVIGLGFASGTIAQMAGDRGWIGGISGANNVMSKWDNTNVEFAFARTTSSATGSFAIASYANLHTNNIQGNIVSASLGFSGSHTTLIDGTSAFIAGNKISITSASNGAVTFSATGVGDVTGPASSTLYAVALFDDTTGKVLRNSALTTNGSDSLWIASDLAVSGSTTFGDATSDTITFTARVNSSILPSSDVAYDLGSESRRWANVYTGDLHLRNDRGDYTLIEEEDFLTIRFNKTGKRYKFVLEAVPQFDEEPALKF